MEMNGKYLWTAKVSDKGQIAIPKQAREVFNIKTGDTLILLGDLNRGIAIVKYEDYLRFTEGVFKEMMGEGEKND